FTSSRFILHPLPCLVFRPPASQVGDFLAQPTQFHAHARPGQTSALGTDHAGQALLRRPLIDRVARFAHPLRHLRPQRLDLSRCRVFSLAFRYARVKQFTNQFVMRSRLLARQRQQISLGGHGVTPLSSASSLSRRCLSWCFTNANSTRSALRSIPRVCTGSCCDSRNAIASSA